MPKTTPEEVLEYEFNVCQSLKWDLYVWLPFRPLQGFLLDCQTVLPKVAVEKFYECHDLSKKFLIETLHSDIYFLHSPSIIALGAIYHTNPTICLQYIEAKKILELQPLIISISANLEATKKFKIEKKKAQDYGRKLYFCMNPLRNKSSALYLKRKAEEESTNNNKWAKKFSTSSNVLDKNPFE